MNRFLDFLSITNGSQILTLINPYEKSPLGFIVDNLDEMHNPVYLDTVTYPVTWYGIHENPPSFSLFSFLLQDKLQVVENGLKQRLDIIKKSPYASLQGKSVDYRSTIEYIRWNEMTLLEMAYLLENQEAIALLDRYGRSIWHKRSAFDTLYHTKAIELANLYGKHHIAEQLLLRQQDGN